MSLELAEKLGAVAAYDLGLQLVRFDDAEEGLTYATVAYVRCEKCRALTTIVSKLDRRILLELPMKDPGAYRLNLDHEAVQAAKARHACVEAPAGARPTR